MKRNKSGVVVIEDYTVTIDGLPKHEPFKERILAIIDDMDNSVWQICPKCNGTGQQYVVRNNNLTNYFQGFETCDLCNGSKIISITTGLPPTNPQKI